MFTRLLLSVVLLIAAWMVLRSINDHAFVQDFNNTVRHMHSYEHRTRKGLGLLILFGFLLASPIWLKLPLSAFLGGSWSANLVVRIFRSVDALPDLAIGKSGIYFPNKLGHASCAWHDISKIIYVKKKSSWTGELTSTIYICGNTPKNPSKWSLAPNAKPKILEIPHSWAMNSEAIISACREYTPNTEITVIGVA